MNSGDNTLWSWDVYQNPGIPPNAAYVLGSGTGVQGQQQVQEIVLDDFRARDTDDLICPLCSDLVQITDAVWREHNVRGTKVSFQVCSACAHVSLCPANMHGIHGEVIEDDDPAARRVQGYCLQCRTPMEWCDGRWRDPEPDPMVAAINTLNGRLQRGDIDMDSYLAELKPLVEVEGSAPAVDDVSDVSEGEGT